MFLFRRPLTEMTIADYNASKAAVISLHESLRYELDKRYVHRSQIIERHLTSAS
jgi:short-subunit dehydrogenase